MHSRGRRKGGLRRMKAVAVALEGSFGALSSRSRTNKTDL